MPLLDLLKKNALNLNGGQKLVAIKRSTLGVHNPLLEEELGMVQFEYRFRQPCGLAAKIFLEDTIGF